MPAAPGKATVPFTQALVALSRSLALFFKEFDQPGTGSFTTRMFAYRISSPSRGVSFPARFNILRASLVLARAPRSRKNSTLISSGQSSAALFHDFVKGHGIRARLAIGKKFFPNGSESQL